MLKTLQNRPPVGRGSGPSLLLRQAADHHNQLPSGDFQLLGNIFDFQRSHSVEVYQAVRTALCAAVDWAILRGGMDAYSKSGFSVGCLLLGAMTAALGAPATESGEAEVHEFLNKYCVTCHNQRLKTGGLTLDAVDLTQVPARAELWEKVILKLRSGTMP